MPQVFHEEMLKTLEQGHIEIVEDFDPKLTPQNFIFLNYVTKLSASQAVRPVSNSGARNLKGFNLNDCTIEALASSPVDSHASWPSDSMEQQHGQPT